MFEGFECEVMPHQSNHPTGTATERRYDFPCWWLCCCWCTRATGNITRFNISRLGPGVQRSGLARTKSKPLVVKASGRRVVWLLLIHNMDVGSGILLELPLHPSRYYCSALLCCPISLLHLSNGGSTGSERAPCLERKGRMEEDDVRRRIMHEPFWCLSKRNGTKTR